MSNPSVVTLQLIAGVSNGIALSQIPAAAGNLTLNGSLVTGGVATFDVARRVRIASNNAGDGGVIFTVTGTNAFGAPISEQITGLANTNKATNQDFLTVTSIANSAATAGNITAGTNGTASTPWVLDNFLAPTWMLAVAVSLPTGPGTAVTYTVEHTYDDPNTTPNLYSSMEPASYQPPLAWPNPTLVNFTQNGEFQYAGWPIMAHRLTITAGTGKAVMQSIQAGIGSP